jgi:poly-gamma-glutamate capsule biosynthesis protein CapA/YwtB (metallophosphatase superfamily)
VHILFAGDMMLDRGTRKTIEKNEVAYLFTDVQEILRQQDIVLVNLEQPVCSAMLEARDKTYCFHADPDWLPAIHACGITHVNLANNHTGDYGKEGIQETMQELSRNHIDYVGADSTFEKPCEPILIQKNGSKLAVFSNTLLYQPEPSGCCNENNKELQSRIIAFKKIHTDYCIVVCLHWGIEMDTLPSTIQSTQAHTFIDAGADLIIGHHPHVVQPIEIYKGKYICYSLGNFVFDKNRYPGNTGIFTCFDIRDNTITLVRVIPFTILDSKPSIMTEADAGQFLYRKGIVF